MIKLSYVILNHKRGSHRQQSISATGRLGSNWNMLMRPALITLWSSARRRLRWAWSRCGICGQGAGDARAWIRDSADYL